MRSSHIRISTLTLNCCVKGLFDMTHNLLFCVLGDLMWKRCAGKTLTLGVRTTFTLRWLPATFTASTPPSSAWITSMTPLSPSCSPWWVCVCLCVELVCWVYGVGLLLHRGWDFSGCSWISGFRCLSESNKNGVELHFKCDFSQLRLQTLIRSHLLHVCGTWRRQWFCFLY